MSMNDADHLQALLHRLRAEVESTASSREQLSQIASQLEQPSEEARYSALLDLLNIINSVDDTHRAIRCDQFVPLLVKCIETSSAVEVRVLACRSLTYIVDMAPSIAAPLVARGRLNTLVDIIRDIFDMELAEQSASCLEKIVNEIPAAMWRVKCGMEGILKNLAFFRISSQRHLLSIALNSARVMTPAAHIDDFKSSLEVIHDAAQSSDERVVELALGILRFILCATSMVDPSQLRKIVGDVPRVCLTLLADNRSAESTVHLAALVLHIAVAGSDAVAQDLLSQAAYDSVASLFDGTKVQSPLKGDLTHRALSARVVANLCGVMLHFLPRQKERPMMTLVRRVAQKLLTAVPADASENESEASATFDLSCSRCEAWLSPLSEWPWYTGPSGQLCASCFLQNAQAPAMSEGPRMQRDSTEASLPPLVECAAAALRTSLQLCSSSNGVDVRRASLATMSRALDGILDAKAHDVFVRDVDPTVLCDFLSRLLGGTVWMEQMEGLYMAARLLDGLPQMFSQPMIREGVANALVHLRSLVSVDERSRGQNPLPTMVGLKAAMAHEAQRLMTLIQQFDDCSKMSSLAALVRRLDGAKAPDKSLNIAVAKGLTDVSAFEVVHSDVASALVRYLRGSDEPAREICEIVLAMSEESRGAVARLVGNLNSAVSQLESFERPPEIINDPFAQLRLFILPHAPDSGDDGIGGLARNRPVTIEAVATVKHVRDFVLRTTQPLAFLSSSGETDDDTAREILPEGGTPPRRTSTASSGTSEVYFRCGGIEVTPSMSMIQILGLTNAEGFERRSSEGAGGSTPSSPTRPSITLHYSWKPFDALVAKPRPTADALVGAAVPMPVGSLPAGKVSPQVFASIIHALRDTEATTDLRLSAPLIGILTLLRVLHVISSASHVHTMMKCLSIFNVIPFDLDAGVFVNASLDGKALAACAQLGLVGTHATLWPVRLALDFPFLFSSGTRKFFFDVGFCGSARAMVRIHDSDVDAHAHPAHRFRLIRQKLRVRRDQILESAKVVMTSHSVGHPGMFEFEFYGEEGKGSGPTHEFYTLLAKEITASTWWDHHHSDKGRLKPRPLNPTDPRMAEGRAFFYFIGALIARALLDQQLLHFLICPTTLKAMVGELLGVNFASLCPFFDKLYSDCFRNAKDTVADAHTWELTMVAPGYDDIELTEGGAHQPVTPDNLRTYLNLRAKVFLGDHLKYATESLREGFASTIPLVALRLLTHGELSDALLGSAKHVSLEELVTYVQAEHGYTAHSPQVGWLLETIAAYSTDEQHRFFQFLTGSPALPIGGLAALRPRITVVRKTDDVAAREQQMLPSVMTCQHFLKLPAYESKEILQKRLRMSIEEGGQSFSFT